MSGATGNPRIAPTAYFTAQAWVHEHFAYAHLFDNWRGRLMFDPARTAVQLLGFLGVPVRYNLEHLYVRHHAYERRLRQLKPSCIVEIGAGLSPRGYAFAACDPGLRYIEGDLPHMVAAKRRALKRVALPPNYFLGAVDLLGKEFEASLPARPLPGDRIAVVSEGVIDYLNIAEKKTAFAKIAGFLRRAGGGRCLFEVHPQELHHRFAATRRVWVSLLGALVGRSFHDRLFETLDDACRFARAAGFDDARVLDLDALNDSAHRISLEECPYRLVEAVVKPA